MAQNPAYDSTFDTGKDHLNNDTMIKLKFLVSSQPVQKPPTDPRTLGRESTICICRSCGHEGMSTVKKVSGSRNLMGALGCVCIGCWLGCCLIPYNMDSLKDTMHSCASCKKLIGVCKH
ncbi:Oidioi.mRNA.OKI2018_I69.PAR.g9903.t1.cds [Oikopleura dioica]|uniref:Oidioi.mRNA.OKI2018_I69.PAR.g9903.t1.cds n=1 Tax=Oikopleura dioica TaxID=34765 RepID=A0ABN7RNT2_OIKDI|nr:Oidioi.mRNA.OKI2018_I69.PAR.g9903.t1.cds [Oikopleura dioica]